MLETLGGRGSVSPLQIGWRSEPKSPQTLHSILHEKVHKSVWLLSTNIIRADESLYADEARVEDETGNERSLP